MYLASNQFIMSEQQGQVNDQEVTLNESEATQLAQGAEKMDQKEYNKMMLQIEKQKEANRKIALANNKKINEDMRVEVDYYTMQAEIIVQRWRAMDHYLKNRDIQVAYDTAVQEDRKKAQEAQAKQNGSAMLEPEKKSSIITMD